jgi:hypothetical protein
MRKTNLVPLLLPLLAIGLAAAEPAETKVLADELEAVAGNTLTSEQKTALAAVDVRLAGVEALAAKIDDPDYKAEVAKQIEDLKRRRLAIEKNFDPGLYEALMHSVISRYQVIALWLKPPPLPPPPPAALEAIENVEIGKNRELRVNGKPFFPLSSWGQSPQRFPLLRSLGFNSFTSGKASEYCDAAQQAGGYAIPGFDARFKGHAALLAHIQGDEPDEGFRKGMARQPAEAVVESYKTMREKDDTRPILLNLTSSFMESGGDGGGERTPADRKAYYDVVVEGGDIVSFDVYPIYGWNLDDKLIWVADGVKQLREYAGPKKPVFACIETCKGSRWVSYELQQDVKPEDTRAEVWMAIIRGATGIIYFTHAWQPTFTEFRPDEEMQKELKRLNAQITRLTPAILADPAKEHVSITLSGGLAGDVTARDHDGSLYLFANNLDMQRNSGTATITIEGLKKGTKVEVIDEGREIVAEEGKFTDEFGPIAVHLYRIRK